MLLKTIPLEARIENQPYGIAGILYHGTEIYEQSNKKPAHSNDSKMVLFKNLGLK